MAAEERKESIQIIRGTPFPKSERFREKNILDAMDYQPQDDDIIIASYPKTGTTWLQYIVLQILSRGENFPTMEEASQKVVPFLELAGVDILASSPKPRIYKHHIPYNLMKKNAKSKYIYIYRHPEDTVVSYYKFIQSFNEKVAINFEEFFERFVSGNIEYGSYFKHVLSYYEYKDDSNILLVSYEKLHESRKEEILRIAKFLGEEYHNYLVHDDEILNKILHNTSFETMKNKLKLVVPVQVATDKSSEGNPTKEINFFRKGIVGDGKQFLSFSQKEVMKDVIKEIMNDTNISKEWLQN